jgi:hypothetical protein
MIKLGTWKLFSGAKLNNSTINGVFASMNPPPLENDFMESRGFANGRFKRR